MKKCSFWWKRCPLYLTDAQRIKHLCLLTNRQHRKKKEGFSTLIDTFILCVKKGGYFKTVALKWGNIQDCFLFGCPKTIDITGFFKKFCIATRTRELLRRALFNLVENAVKYGPEGGQVRLCAELDGTDMVISVADQGPYIPPELRERVFEPFFRVDTTCSRKLGGTSLGLALVRSIAEAHGGSVWVKEHQAGGNRFVLQLPAVL